jgi:hypothetical protein
MVQKQSTSDCIEARLVPAPLWEAAMADVAWLRQELTRERQFRRAMEARAMLAEKRAAAAEEQAAIAEWLVTVLRGELRGGQPRFWCWRWPWRQHDTPRGW